jgi:hypothetical protein
MSKASNPTSRGLRRVAAAATLLGLALAAGVAHADFDDHPHLVAADREAYQAMMQLRAASNGPAAFGGHRARALHLLEQARREIHESARFADHHRD